MAEKKAPFSSDTDIMNTSLSPDIIRDAMDSDSSKLYKRLLGVESPTIGEIVGFPGSRTGRFGRVDKLRSAIQEQIATRALGPTQGQAVAGGMGNLVGYSPDPMSNIQAPEFPKPTQKFEFREPLQPSPTHSGAMQLFQPNAPLDPIQTSRLGAVMQRAGLAPQLPNEGMLGQSRMDDLVSILKRQGIPEDKAKLEVYGSKGHLYSPSAKPGSIEEQGKEADIRLTKGKAREQEEQNVFNPTKFLQEEEKRTAEIEKLRLEVEQAPENLKIKKDLAKSLMGHREKSQERSKKITESIISMNMSTEDRNKALAAINNMKVWEYYASQEDISREDQSAARAKILESLGFLTEMDQRYPGLLRTGIDPGQKRRKLVEENTSASKKTIKNPNPSKFSSGDVIRNKVGEEYTVE